MPRVLGLDIGTTSTIGILIRPPDETLALASRQVTLRSDHIGWAEEDPEQWWSNVGEIVREIFTGLFASDMGLWQADCAGALRLRHSLGRDDMKLLFNINAEFAHSLDERPIALRAKSAVFSSLADAILVSGPLTGDPVDRSNLKTVRDAVPNVPVLANTGVTVDNVCDILAISDGVVIGTHFKLDGNTWNPVDGARVKRFMDAVAKLR